MKKIATKLAQDFGDQSRHLIKASEANLFRQIKSASGATKDDEIVKKINSVMSSGDDNLTSPPNDEILLFGTLLSSVVTEPLIGELSDEASAHELMRNTSSAVWSSSESVLLMAQAIPRTWPQISTSTSTSAVISDITAGIAQSVDFISGINNRFLWIGFGALGLAGMAGGGSKTDSGIEPSKTIVSGTLVAGPVISGNTLKVSIYAANGSTKIGESALDESGKFSVSVGTYTGVIIARVINSGSGNDYLDEATGRPKELNATLMAVAVVSGGTIAVNINPLTTIAAQKAGLAADGSGNIANAAAVSNANAAVAEAFGLVNLIGTSVVATNSGSFKSADGLSNEEKFGAVLAALSGADLARGGDSQAIINEMVAGLSISGGTGTLSNSALDTIMAGANVTANAVGGADNTSLTSILSSLTAQVSASVSIDSITTDGVLNASEQTVASITGTTVAGAAVALSIGGTTRNATVTGITWIYNLQDSDIAAMGEGGETIRATATLIGGGTASASRSIFVDTIAPTLTSSALASVIPENSGANQTIYTATSTDTTAGAATYSLQIAAGDSAAFGIDGTSGEVKLTFNPDYETKTSFSFIVVATDAAGNAAEKEVTLSVTNLNDNAPVFTSGATGSVAENAATSTVIYTAATTDADNLAARTFTLSGTDAALLNINAGVVTLKASADFETKASYSFNVVANDGANNATQAVVVSVTNVVDAGESMIDLGSFGKLIAPVQVDGGQWFYYWDLSGDGTSSNRGTLNEGVDFITHDVLDGIFNQDINGLEGGNGNTSDTYRYTTINGLLLALPTVGGVISSPYGSGGINAFQPGTAVGSTTAANGSDTVNATYNDLLAVWDAYNGTGTGTGLSSNILPLGWREDNYWSATATDSGHAFVNLRFGYVLNINDSSVTYVALQVL